MSPLKLPARRLTWVTAIAMVAVWPGSGCRPDQDSLRHARPSDLDIRQTFDKLRECRQEGAYAAMRPHIHSSAREGIVDLLVAVDELLLANAAALEAMQRACPEIDARPYDLALIQDNLELFSRDVEWVDARQEGEAATVTVQISHRLPLVRLQFERHQGVWQYLPGPEQPRIVMALRQLTHAVQQLELVFSSSRLTPRQVDREYHLRLDYRLKRLTSVAEAGEVQDVASLSPTR